MAQFRTTADIMDLALANAGEVTNGNSPYETDLLNKLNRCHYALVAGGTIPLGLNQTVEIDEVWPWARARRPLILELQAAYETGTVTLTLGSEAGTFSSAPSYSVAGWYIRVPGREGTFRIASHTASSTSFELDGVYPLSTGSGLSFSVFKLDYELTPDYIVIDSTNNKLDFYKTSTGGTELTASLTAGTYTPAQLATHIGTQMTAATSGPTFTCSYSSTTRKFTITSDGASSTSLRLYFATGTNQLFSVHKTIGFDDADTSAALSQVGTYILGGIARLIAPMKLLHTGAEICGTDFEAFSRNYALNEIGEGTPNRFALLSESPDGIINVRFNAYPDEKMRVEVEHVAVPRDLKDSAGSIPLVPRKHVDVLEDAATYYIMLLKSDSRAADYANLVAGKLKAMIAQHRGQEQRTGQDFGRIIPRRENLSRRRGPRFGDPYT